MQFVNMKMARLAAAAWISSICLAPHPDVFLDKTGKVIAGQDFQRARQGCRVWVKFEGKRLIAKFLIRRLDFVSRKFPFTRTTAISPAIFFRFSTFAAQASLSRCMERTF